MEMKYLRSTFFCLLALVPLCVRAQDASYALPMTSVTVKVDIRQEVFFAGPYADFAKKMLNLTAPNQDYAHADVVRAQLIPHVEADPDACYTCDMESAALLALGAQGLVSLGGRSVKEPSWRFLPGLSADFKAGEITSTQKEVVQVEYKEVQTDTALISVPVEHRVLVEKTLEDKASDAADMILSLRKERLNIITGNTDANYSGAAMETALRELDRIEKEYLALFTGYSVVNTVTRVFEVIPSAQDKQYRYLVFRLSDEGIVSAGSQGTPYYLELDSPKTAAEEAPEQDRRRSKGSVYYRTPAVCKVALTRDGVQMLETRIPFYQLGKTGLLYLNK